MKISDSNYETGRMIENFTASGGVDTLIYVSDDISMPRFYSPMFARPTVDRRLSVPDGLSSVVPVRGFHIAPA